MPLKIELKPDERLIIGNAAIRNGPRRASFVRGPVTADWDRCNAKAHPNRLQRQRQGMRPPSGASRATARLREGGWLPHAILPRCELRSPAVRQTPMAPLYRTPRFEIRSKRCKDASRRAIRSVFRFPIG